VDNVRPTKLESTVSEQVANEFDKEPGDDVPSQQEEAAPEPSAVHEAIKTALTDAGIPQITLAPCPCGEVPNGLIMECSERAKFGRAAGQCCGSWYIEYFNRFESDQNKMLAYAVTAWNDSPRAA